MSPESTVTYYEYITRTYAERYGDYGYPEILIYSVNFQMFVEWQRQGRWHEAATEMAAALARLHAAGAGFGLIASNTMHIVFDQVQQAVPMPLLSIVDATAQAVRAAGLKTVALLGTIFTMTETFYRDGLAHAGLEVLVPGAAAQDQINAVIYDELCRGDIRPGSRRAFLEIIEGLRRNGAEGIILGCTEIPLLIRPQDTPLPLFNTSILHAEKALRYAVGATAQVGR
jgi:aspartate racemase